MSQNPTPEEVLTAWDSESAKWNTWLKANNATSDIIAEALREALAQRDEAYDDSRRSQERMQRVVDGHSKIEAQLDHAQAKLEFASVCWDHETKRADEAQAKLASVVKVLRNIAGHMQYPRYLARAALAALEVKP